MHAKGNFMIARDPCPFCASEETAAQEIDRDRWMVECLRCHATGPIGNSATAAKQTWNHRIPCFGLSEKNTMVNLYPLLMEYLRQRRFLAHLVRQADGNVIRGSFC